MYTDHMDSMSDGSMSMTGRSVIVEGWLPVGTGVCARCDREREVDSIPLCEDCWAQYAFDLEEQDREERRRLELGDLAASHQREADGWL